ncbi:retention module-containing protein, partial [Chitinimonas taiwanensis]
MAANQVSAQARGVVVQLQGQAWAVDANGNKRVLRVGDAVQEGEQLITAAGTQLELGLPNGQSVAVAAERTLLIDANLLGTAPVDASEAAIADLNAGAEQVIAALNEGRDLSLELDPTAAGLAGGEGGDAHGFVRLLRISEDTSPIELTSSARAAEADTVEFTQGTAAAAAAEIEPNGPQANNDQATVDEDGTVSINVLGNDNGDGLRVQGQPTAGNGTVSVNADGTLSYVPNSNFNGSDTISYTVVDANGNTSTATVSVTVNPVNDAPTINGGNSQNVSTLEDTPLSGSVAGSDVDGDPLNYGKGSDPSHGSVAVNPDGSWTYTPNSNYNGPDSFTIVVSDGKGGTDTVTINVGVTPVDDLPVISSGAGSVVEDSQPSTSGTLSASDVDNPDLRFVAANPAGQYGSLSIGSDGKWTYTLDARAEQLAANEARVETFTVTLNDGSTRTIVINVTGTNDGAVIGAGAGDTNTGSVTEDTTLTSSGKLTVTDVDNGQAELKP